MEKIRKSIKLLNWKYKRNGLYYSKFLEALNRERFPSKKLLKMQFERLKSIVEYSYENVNFYNEYWSKNNFHPTMLKTSNDIKKIPVIDKSLLKSITMNRRIANGQNISGLRKDKTSGTTSSPLVFYKDPNEMLEEEAAWARDLSVGHCTIADRIVYIRFGKVKRDARKFRKFLQSMLNRELQLSVFEFEEYTLSNMTTKVKNFSPDIVYGYVSALVSLAKYILRNKIKFNGIRMVIPIAEQCSSADRKILMEAFNSEVYTIYGSSECMRVGYECEKHCGLHIDTSRFFIEVLPKDKLTTKKGLMGEIVLTNLTNYIHPFIRYKIGDHGTLLEKRCKCGRSFPLLEVYGRDHDLIITMSGKYLYSIFFTEIFENEELGILDYQVVQRQKGMINFKYVPGGNFSPTDLKKIDNWIRKKSNNEIIVKYTKCKNIKLEKSGKKRIIKSNLGLVGKNKNEN